MIFLFNGMDRPIIWHLSDQLTHELFCKTKGDGCHLQNDTTQLSETITNIEICCCQDKV